VVQVGRSAAAVLAVTTAGYVRTRVARVRTGLSRENAAALAALLNRNLTFVAPVDLSTRMLSELCSQIAPELVPVVSAAAAILQDSVKPHVFLGGEQYLLDWPQLDGRVGDILTLLNDEEQAASLIAPPENRSESVLLGEDLEPQIPGLCIVSDRYLVGGGLWGSIALIGPTRMPFQKLMPLLHEFADQLGEGMSGKRKDTPQAAVPRRTVIYKEDLE
jgi:heat-inducible transcriptional repressor